MIDGAEPFGVRLLPGADGKHSQCHDIDRASRFWVSLRRSVHIDVIQHPTSVWAATHGGKLLLFFQVYGQLKSQRLVVDGEFLPEDRAVDSADLQGVVPGQHVDPSLVEPAP